jgi:hypothetical protein
LKLRYNRWRFKTDKRFKVYIGNDASDEDPTQLLEKFQNQFDFEYQYYETNLGSLTRNNGNVV